MTSRQRPPLTLHDPEVEPEAHAGAADLAPEAPARPPVMSERRRRKLAEEARLKAEAETREASTPAPVAETPPLADPAAGTPPAPRAAGEPAAAPSESPTLVRPTPIRETRGPGVAAFVAAAVWAGGVASWLAYEVGSGAVELETLRVAVYALLALAPAGLILIIAQALRQGARLAAEIRRARELADNLTAPTALAARQSGDVLQGLRSDIDQAALAAERARNDLTLLRETLGQETQRLNDAAETAARTARRLSEQLAAEREAMSSLGGQLDTQATAVVDAVERQSRMVGDASDLAQTQLREAEAALAARAADLAAAAQVALDAARLAADDRARHTIRLVNAGTGVAEQIQSVEEGLGQQRAALVSAVYALRTEQEDFSAQVESQRAQLIDQLSQTRTAAGELSDLSRRAGETLAELVEAAGDQFRALIELSAREADEFDAATKVSLDKFDAVAADARDRLVEETRRALEALSATAEDARRAADAAAEQAQVRADRLGEALFDAAQKADAAADARLEEARRLATDAAELVDIAGQEAVARLETTLARLTGSLDDIRQSVAEVDQRAQRLPETAHAQMQAIRETVEAGLAALAEAARRAASDTEALEAGFQDRVRRNYDMLTETVRLMGVVSGDPAPRRPVTRAPDVAAADLQLPEARRGPREPAPEPPAPGRSEAGRSKSRRDEPSRGFGLRGRLRLDAGEPPASGSEKGPLDWSDLGATDEAPLELDARLAPAGPSPDAAAVRDRVTQAIRRMGVDPNALLPRARVEDAASALAAGDADAARQIVRRVAPAAVRSVSRRVLSDPALRADVERHVRATALSLAEAARRGDATAVSDQLSTDAGRAFLLLDAAVGDLA